MTAPLTSPSLSEVTLSWGVAALGLIAFAVVLALLAVLAGSVRARSDLRRELDTLAQRVAALEAEPRRHAEAAPVVDYVITGLGHEDEQAVGRTTLPADIDAPLFADLVLREGVVKAASYAHGLRRALAPETRNRIRFQMRQEVRRSRKQRRDDLKAAQRDLRARQRGNLGDVVRETGEPA